MSTWRKPHENHRNTKEQTIGQEQQQRSNMEIIKKQKENHRKTMWKSQEKAITSF